MTNANSTASPPVPAVPDRFMETLRKSLEHIDEPDWLAKNSPLESALFASASVATEHTPQVYLTGRSDVDSRLRTIWHEWEARPKTPLQALLWQSVCHLSVAPDSQTQAILLLTYFDYDHPKQSQVIRLLAMGRATYYRHLNQAVERLAQAATQRLRPALRLEKPTVRPLIGRTEQIAQAESGLEAGKVVHVIGGSGLGKTVLAAHLAHQWPHGVFWYTFRPGLTDYLEQLFFAIAYFLHERGVSGLWLYLTTDPEPFSPARAILSLRQHLADLQQKPPLFCFDEVNLLLADDLNDSDEHLQLRSLFDEWCQMDRCGSPLLLVGQKLLLEPEPDCLIQLTPFTATELASYFQHVQITFSPTQNERLRTFTRGNPLLLQLFLVLYQRTDSVIETLERLTTPMTLDWFLTRLNRYLSSAELVVLHELSVFQGDAPLDAWTRLKKHLHSLMRLGLVEQSSPNHVSLHPALRERIYGQLPLERRTELHLAAGHLLAERGRFTAAAWHYVQGNQPEMAIWTWYTHRQQEIDQGQASTAFALFAPLTQTSLPRADDQRALALLLAPLFKGVGRSREGLALLEKTTWPSASVSTASAHKMRGELLIDAGEIERGLTEFRQGLELVKHLSSTEEAELHLKLGSVAFARLGEISQARQHVLDARLSVETLQGRIEKVAGHFEAPRLHYTNALALAEETTDHLRLMSVHEGLGFLEASLGNLDEAIIHAEAVEQLHQVLGHPASAVAAPNSILAVAYLVAQQYEEALKPAETALAYFTKLDHAYWMALNQTYLAEAWLYLGDIEQAEFYAQSALSHEEVNVRPYCLYLLGHVRRMQKKFADAEWYCQAAIAEGEAQENPDAIAPAWSALGETLRDAGRPEEAQSAFEESIQIWTRVGLTHQIKRVQNLLDDIR